MQSLERALNSVLSGDLSAAEALRTEVERRDLDVQQLLTDAAERSPAAMAAVVVALDAVDQASDLVATHWAASQWDAVERLGKGLGVQLDATVCARMQPLIDTANHRRRLRKIGPAHLVRAMAWARQTSHGLGFDHGGKSSSTTGVVLAVVHEDGSQLTLGTAKCSGQKPSPGAAWHGMSPWQSKNLSRNRDKALVWAAELTPTRMLVNTAPLPAFERAVPRAPASPIDKALAHGPGRKALTALISIANRARKADTAQVINRIDDIVTTWPDHHRVATNKWLKSLQVDARKGKWRPGYRWYRALELMGHVAPDLIDAFLASPFAPQLHGLIVNECNERRPGPVEVGDWLLRLVRDGQWDNLREAQLNLVWNAPLIEHLAAAPVLGQLETLTIGGSHWNTSTQTLPTLIERCSQLQTLVIETLGNAQQYTGKYTRQLHTAISSLQRLRHLTLPSFRLGPQNLVAAMSSPNVGGLESLDVNFSDMQERTALEECFAGHAFGHLHTAALRNLRLRSDPVPVLAGLPLDAVRDLRLGLEYPLDASDLAGSPLINGLESLKTFNLQGAAAVLRDSDLENLRTLEIIATNDPDLLDAVGDLVRSGSVEALNLGACHQSSALLGMLSTVQRTNLRTLDLTRTSLRGVSHRLEVCLPPQLDRLVLTGCKLTEEQIRELQRSPKFAQTEIVA